MRNNRPLYWGQGQFLTPQHLQQQDLFYQGYLQDLWRQSQPFGWGICRLRIREEGLAAGLVEILACELITRDGVVLQAGLDAEQPNAMLTPKSFQGLLDPAGGPLSIYLAIPRYQPGQRNLSASAPPPAGALPPRYQLHHEDRADQFDPGQPEAAVALLEHNLVILFDREEGFAQFSQAAELLKVAELQPEAGGAGVKLSAAYIPPCLNIAASGVLYNRLKDVRDLLTSKGLEFAELKRQRGIRATAQSAQEAIRLIMLQTLNRYIPLLHHHLEIGRLHPEPAYALLRQMVAEFSAFSEEVSALGAVPGQAAAGQSLPPYDHENLWFCFDQVIRRLKDLVLTMTTGAEAGIRLVYQDRFYQAKLDPPFFEGMRNRYYLVIDSLIRGPELWDRLQKTGKVSPIEDMPQLLKQALFGLKIDLLPVAPEEFPQRGGNNSYFQIDTNHPMWGRIREKQNIAMYCDLDPNETVIKIYVIRSD